MEKHSKSGANRGEPGPDRRRSGGECASEAMLAAAAPERSPSAAAGTAAECSVQPKLRRLPRAGPENREAWAARRRRFKHSSELVGRGNAPGSQVALRRESCATVVCCRAGCAALVHLHSARRRAQAEGRTSFAAGDGCAGPRCSLNWRRSQFAAAQRRMAAALVAAERFLAPWPTCCDDGDLRYFPTAAAEAAAEAALAAL